MKVFFIGDIRGMCFYEENGRIYFSEDFMRLFFCMMIDLVYFCKFFVFIV